MKANTGLDYKEIAGSVQYGNTVTWFWNSPTGDSSDSITHTFTYEQSTEEQVLAMRKSVHFNSTNPECPAIH